MPIDVKSAFVAPLRLPCGRGAVQLTAPSATCPDSIASRMYAPPPPLPSAQGFVVLCGTMDEAVSVCDTIAPEHLEVQVADSDAVWKRISNYGGMFIGANSAGACRALCGGLCRGLCLIVTSAGIGGGPWDVGTRAKAPSAAAVALTSSTRSYPSLAAAEVFGDYGAGPNHVLPTSGTARYTGGLSVFTFLVRFLAGCGWLAQE